MIDAEADPRVLAAALRASQVLELDGFLEHCAAALDEMLRPAGIHAYLRGAGEAGLELRGSWPERRRGSRRPPARLEGGAGEWASQIERAVRAGGSGTGGGSAGAGADIGPGAALIPVGEHHAPGLVLLAIAAAEKTAFDASDLARARSFARLVGPALRNLLYVGDLRETAVRDDIARCYNRRHFEAFVGEEVARAKRFRSRVSILFLDMDDLKSINTAHGHAMGSRSLQELAARIASGIRNIDKLFRFGGDEFCLVLPETDQKGALMVAERTRRAIVEAPFLVAEVGGVTLSASLGVATFPEHASGPGELVQAADRAMQRAKRGGKNQTASAPPRPAPSPGDPERSLRGEAR